eukprot:TRINITY_DN26742_c0_g1_i2.p1 TRINITY_DN26742_c0_g1~~TRINITY_DN26742_c0_g1_i2.p1  ORF type:complete len:194 (-),score=37.39 TRINITY_DN26742_c0_g1_i2:344-925(-)
MNISEEKAVLRKILLNKRKAIPHERWESLSVSVIENLKNIPQFLEAKCTHVFVSMNERNEVNTHMLIKELIESGKKVIVPVTEFSSGTLNHSKLTSFEELESNKWGVLEPKVMEVTDEKPDVILVPLLAADLEFNRLGYGKGFYDRFLSESSALTIGLVFQEYILDKIPVERFDQKLDILVTEKDVFTRNNQN